MSPVVSLFLSSVSLCQVFLLCLFSCCLACVVMPTSFHISCLILKSQVSPCSMCFVLLHLWCHYGNLCQQFPHVFPIPLITSCVYLVCVCSFSCCRVVCSSPCQVTEFSFSYSGHALPCQSHFSCFSLSFSQFRF